MELAVSMTVSFRFGPEKLTRNVLKLEHIGDLSVRAVFYLPLEGMKGMESVLRVKYRISLPRASVDSGPHEG